jgi:ribonuclease BN (tRNA processing enzyme)
MRLTVVGCSGSVPGPTSAASCYLVEADGFALVLDLGGGALGPLQRYVDLAKIGTVLLSHLHADHCVDLTSLSVALKHGPFERDDAIPVLGPSDLARRVRDLHGHEAADLGELGEIFRLGVVAEESWPVGPFQITARRVDHPVEAYAYRIEHGARTLAYSGDCAPCPGLDEVVRGADLALVEAAYGAPADDDASANSPGIHHTGREAGELATRVGAARLVVTHVPPWRDAEAAAAAARAAFAGPVEVASPGASYEV